MAGFYGRTGIEFTDTLTANLERLEAVIRPLAIEAVTEGAELIRAQAYLNANVSPGIRGNGVNGEHMRDEIKVEVREKPNGVDARIAIDMDIIPYAAHQEFGARGNAFLSRAVDSMRDAAHERMRTVFSAGLDSNGKFKSAVRFRRYA
jgi:Bacteriophage protein of unknown function (DUF646).